MFLLLFTNLIFAQTPRGVTPTNPGLGPSRPSGDTCINCFDNPNSMNLRVIIRADSSAVLASSRIHIELENTTSTYHTSQYTDEQGEARFINLVEGSYVMKVTGNIKESGREISFTLNYADKDSVQYIDVHFKSSNPNDVSGMGQTATSNQLAAPPKAREEVSKGKAAFDKKQFQEAKKHFEAALVIFPKYGSALNSMGVLAEQEKNDDAAKKYYEQAMEADPTYPESYINMGKFASAHQDFATSEKAMTKYISLLPLSGEGLMILTNAQVMNGHYDDAIGSSRKALQQDPKQFAFAHVLAAVALEGESKYPDAILEYQEYLKLKPSGDNADKVRAAIQNLQNHITKP